LKTIRTDFLIKQIAENLSTEFNMKPREISSYTTSLLKGIVHHATVAGNLDGKFKHNHHSKVACPKCGKKIKDQVLHNVRSHGGKMI